MKRERIKTLKEVKKKIEELIDCNGLNYMTSWLNKEIKELENEMP